MQNSQMAVRKYYERLGTKLGYNLVMKGNKHFGYYDTTHTDEPAAQKRFLEKFAVLLDLQPGMKVLDAGCGQGYIATYLAASADCDITGITLVPFEVACAKKLARKRNVSGKTHFIVGDYAKPPFPDSSFDRIYAVETLSHAPDVASVCEQFFRMLKPGGKLVCIEYECVYEKLTKSDMRTLEFAMEYGALHGARQFAPGQFIRTLRSSGFSHPTEADWTKACLPSFLRLRRIALPFKIITNRLRIEKYFINTTVAYGYANWAEQGKFFFKAYTALKQ